MRLSERAEELDMAQWGEAVSRLVRLTESGELKWGPLPRDARRPDAIAVYGAEFAGQRLRLSRYRSKVPPPGQTPGPFSMFATTAVIVDALAIVDAAGATSFTFPFVPQLADLQAAVTNQLADDGKDRHAEIDAFLTALKAAS